MLQLGLNRLRYGLHNNKAVTSLLSVGRAFDGTSFLTFNPRANLLFEGATQITALARVFIDPSGSGTRTALCFNIDDVKEGLILGVSSGGKVTGGGRSQAADALQSKVGLTSAPTTGYHLISTIIDIANDTVDVQLDGVSDTSGSNSVTFGASAYVAGAPLNLDHIGAGSFQSSPVQLLKCLMCDAAVYARALGLDELVTIAQGGRPSMAAGGEPVIYFPLDEETDGPGRFAKTLFGGLVAVPTGAVAPTTTRPSVQAHTPRSLERRVLSTRAWNIRGSDVAGVGDGNAVPAFNIRDSGVKATPGLAGPIYKLLAAGGAIRFDAASSQYLTTPGKIDIRRGFTFVALIDARNNGRVFSAASLATADTLNSAFFSPTVGLGIGGSTTAAFSTYADYTVGSSGLGIFSGWFSGNSISNRLNGVIRNGTVTNGTELSDGTFTVNSLPSDSTSQLMQFGRRLHSTLPLYGDFDWYDGIWINGALPDENVQYLEGVVAWRNNVTALLP